MELKVWVDGIQRVVCGANYATTCQDVVLALASAMGRTGRFTLVEKWRDSERSLTPAECPLLSRHKWGEYDGDVRYYLIQAEIEMAEKQAIINNKINTQDQNMHAFSHNFTQAEKTHRHLRLSGPEFIKRSSTFSGAHKSANRNFPSSVCQSPTPTTRPQHSCNQQTTVSISSSFTAQEQQSGFTLASTGKPVSSASELFNKPSPKSASISAKDVLARHTPRGSLSEALLNPPLTSRDDVRELHPANVSDVLSSHFSQAGEYFLSHTHGQHASKQSKLVLSRELISPHETQQSHPEQPHQTSTVTSRAVCSSSSINYCPSATTTAPNSYNSQQSQLPSSSYSPYSQRNSPRQQYRPAPAPRHQPVLSPLSSNEQSVSTNIQNYKKLQQSDQLLDKLSQSDQLLDKLSQSVPACISSKDVDSARIIYNEDNERNSEKETGTNISNYYHYKSGQNNTILHPESDCMLETGRHHQHGPHNKAPLTFDTLKGNTEGRSKSTGISKLSIGRKVGLAKSATLDRNFTRSRSGQALHNRSLSTDDGDKCIMSDELQLVSVSAKLLQVGEDRKSSTVSLANVEKQEYGTDGSSCSKRMSSFASAVAHIRQHSGETVLEQSKTGSHVRQHSTDSSQTDASHRVGFALNAMLLSMQDEHYISNSNSNTGTDKENPQCNTNLEQHPSNKASLLFVSKSAFQHNSASKDILRSSRYPEASFSPPLGSAVCKTNSTDRKHGSHLCTNNNSKSQDSFHTGRHDESFHTTKVNFEADQNDTDQNLTDSLKRDTVISLRSNEQYQPNSRVGCKNIVRVTPSQIDADYAKLLMTVKMQQEKLKAQEAKIRDASLEITALKKEEGISKAKLEETVEEALKLEKQEAKYKEEIENLGMNEWRSVLDQDKKVEAEIKLQITILKEKLEQMESQIRQLQEEEYTKSEELNLQEDKNTVEKRKNNELEEKAILEMKQLEDQLASLYKITEQNKERLKDVEREILKIDIDLNKKEGKARIMEVELNDDKKLSNTPLHSIIPASNSTFHLSDNGTVILKILEGHLSSRSSQNSHKRPDDGDLSLGGVSSAQHLYKATMTVKNPSGVYV